MRSIQAKELLTIGGGIGNDLSSDELDTGKTEESGATQPSNPPVVVKDYQSGSTAYDRWVEKQTKLS